MSCSSNVLARTQFGGLREGLRYDYYLVGKRDTSQRNHESDILQNEDNIAKVMQFCVQIEKYSEGIVV